MTRMGVRRLSAFIFDQAAFVRGQTLKALEGVSQETAERVPAPFRNSILWHAGHIYVVQERAAFVLTGLEAKLPESLTERFLFGTSPLDWTGSPPALSDIVSLLREQTERIRETLRGRLDEPSPKPYTTSSGITLTTRGEFLNFTLYHEGMHGQSIRLYKMLLQ